MGLDLDLGDDQRAIDHRIQQLRQAWQRGNPVARSSAAELGLPLSAVDMRELEYRERYYPQAYTVIARWVKLHAWSGYAGYEIDSEHGGIVYVGFTADQDAQLEAMKREVALIAPDRIRPFPVPPTYSIRELNTLFEEILDEPKSPLLHLINEMGIEVLANRVEVGTEHVAKVKRLFAERYGPDAPISVVFMPPIEFLPSLDF